MKQIIYKRKQFEKDLILLGKRIKRSKFDPDVIVGVGRGGSYIGIMLSHYLNISFRALNISMYDNNYEQTHDTALAEDCLLNDKKTLIVDDICDNGNTFKFIKEDWISGTLGVKDQINWDNLKWATLWYNTSQDFNVDIYINKINRKKDDRWIVFPWENWYESYKK